jgi:hypothetical protein
MLGWHIAVHRFSDPELREHRGDLESIRAQMGARRGTTEVPEAADEDLWLAIWQTG